MRLPNASDTYDRTNEQQARRSIELAIGDIERKLSTLLTEAGTLAANKQDLTLSNGTNNNVAIGYGTLARVTGPTALFTVTGLDGGQPGRVLILRNTTSRHMVLANESASSTDVNRIITQTGSDVLLDGNGGSSAVLFYDGTSSRWVLVAGEAAPAVQINILDADRTGSNANTAQDIFGTANNEITLQANTTYVFEALYFITRAAGTTSHTTSLAFGGTAGITTMLYVAWTANPDGSALGAPTTARSTTTAATAITAANTSATEELRILVKGVLRVSTSGTLIPRFQYSAAPGGAPTIKAQTYFQATPIGSDTVTFVGNWS